MRKFNWLDIWINVRLLLMSTAVIFLFSFTAKRNSDRKLTKSMVYFLGDENLFVTSETVNKLLIENKKKGANDKKR